MDVPMSSEEQKVTLVVEGDDLSALELWHGREERLKHAADGVAQAGHKAVENEFGEMGSGAGVSLANRRVNKRKEGV